jgi:hypothetical protein
VESVQDHHIVLGNDGRITRVEIGSAFTIKRSLKKFTQYPPPAIDKNSLWAGLNIQKRQLFVKGILGACQTNLEMSAFYQDRNVRFS